MCRNFAVVLRPTPATQLHPALLAERLSRARELAESCSKRNTSAGYDAAGMAVACALPQGGLDVRVARDGGDLLESWDRLEASLRLDGQHVTAWLTHVRQASQGDMYSEYNAHPHRDEGVGDSLFFTMHNGDIQDAPAYKRFLGVRGFRFASNSDSCVAPALTRYLLDCPLETALADLAAAGILPSDSDVGDMERQLKSAGAAAATRAAALAARILEHSNADSKFTFQSFSPLDGGVYTTVRGGSRRGGEEGGEAVFYLPHALDQRNLQHVAFLCASEENALKDQIALLDPASPDRLAEPRRLPLHAGATAILTEGVAPIYDVRPGEIVEVSAAGNVRVFDIYDGIEVDFRARGARMAPLKVFRLEYGPDGCPYSNKYGEEIGVVQPLALRLNSERLFGPGPATLTPAALGLRLDADEVRSLRHIVTGGAGTSYLMNTVAAGLARKLGLHRLPIINMDGFTGSDMLPPFAGSDTLFVANSNSGGTSDTVRLAQRMAKAGAWVYAITNIEASPLGAMGQGLAPGVKRAAGAGITNLPEEECVGSTFAALGSLQLQLALHAYIGQLRGELPDADAACVYADLARLPEVCEAIVTDRRLLADIRSFAEEHVGGNFDFVYTDYLDGVADEQAHKAAEMIQEMFSGWNFFLFQHGKYAHMKRRTRHSLGSILGHNCPPPSWPLFNARARKSPFEMGPRVGTTFVVAHESDRSAFEAIPDYTPDYVFTYPADSVALYPFQTIIIGQLISYEWGLAKQRIGDRIAAWNQPFVDALAAPTLDRPLLAAHARQVLAAFQDASRTPAFDNAGTRRREAILHGLTRLADNLDDSESRHVLRDLALELSNPRQARALANSLPDGGNTILTIPRPNHRTRQVREYDYVVEYEGLGALYTAEPVHPPKVAKAKKGWL